MTTEQLDLTWAESLADPDWCLSVPAEAKKALTALIAEVGRLRPRIVTTAEELDQMPKLTVVRTEGGVLFTHYPGGWVESSDGYYDATYVMRGEEFVTVLYTPEETRL